MALDLGELVAFLDLDTKKWDSSVDRMPGALSGKAAMFGAAGLIIGGVIAAALTKGLTDAMNFEDSLAQISGQLSLTEAESARVGAAAGRVYAENYGESVEQVQSVVGGIITQIEGMGEASNSTVDGMTAKVLNYASAFGFETSEAIAMVQQLMSSGLASSADEAMDLMTASMQRVPEALRGDMADAITEYGPLLADLGFNGVEAFDLLVSGAERGMYGIDKAGDAVKEFGIRATDMSAASKGAYDALGMSQEDMTNKLLAGGDTAKDAFTTIVNGLLGIEDPAAQSQAALALFGTPLEDLGVKNIPTFLESLGSLGTGMQDTAGAAEAMGDKMGSSTASKMEAMNRQVEIMMAGLMEGLLPVLSAVFGFLADNPAVIQAVAIALGILAVAFLGVAAAMWAASLTPISLIIGAIIIGIGLLVAAIVWLVQNWDQVWATIAGLWEGFVGWFTGIVDGFISWWNDLWGGFGDGVAAGWEAVVAWFQNLPTAIGEFFLGVGEWLLDIGRMLLEGLATGIAMAVVAVWYFFTQFPTDLLNFLIGAGLWLIQTGTDILTGLWNGIVAGYEAVVAWFTALPGMILAFLITAGQWLLNTGISLIEGLRSGILNAWNAVVAWFNALPGVIVSFLAAAGQWLLASGRNIIEGARQGIVNGWNAVASWFQSLPGTIAGFFSGAGKWLWDMGRNIVQGLLDGIKSLGSTIGNFFLGLLPDWIKEPFKAALGIHSPSRVFAEYGRNTVEGYMAGIEKMQPDLDKRMGELVDTPSLSASITSQSGTLGDVDAKAGTGSSSTLIYYAAENRSLSAEEDLFAALGSPRATNGKGE